jgi:hypothetical protein
MPPVSPWPKEILILGQAPQANWAKNIFDEAIAREDAAQPPVKPDVRVVEHGDLKILQASPQGRASVVLLDRLPAVRTDFSDWRLFAEDLRQEAHRLVYAIELQRSTEQCLVVQLPPADEHSAIASLLDLLPGIAPNSAARDGQAPQPPRLDELQDPSPPTSEVAERAHHIRSRYIAPLRDSLVSGSPASIAWPRELFISGDTAAPPILELAGGVRYLYFGPYLPIPRGKWIVTGCLGFGPEIGNNLFTVEAYTDTILTKGFILAEAPGIYRFSLPLTIDQVLAPLQIRIVNQQAMLEGTMALIDIQITPGEVPSIGSP